MTHYYDCPMMGGSGGLTMIAMSVVWVLVVAVLVLSIAALVKYLRSGRNG